MPHLALSLEMLHKGVFVFSVRTAIMSPAGWTNLLNLLPLSAYSVLECLLSSQLLKSKNSQNLFRRVQSVWHSDPVLFHFLKQVILESKEFARKRSHDSKLGRAQQGAGRRPESQASDFLLPSSIHNGGPETCCSGSPCESSNKPFLTDSDTQSHSASSSSSSSLK